MNASKFRPASKPGIGASFAMSRRAVLAIAAVLVSTHGFSQTYPTKTITIVVPFAPGGATDLIARIVAPRLASRLGKDVIVDNRSGAGGLIGAGVVANAAADGHTLLLTDTSFAASAALMPDRPLASGKEFTAVTLVATAPYVIAVNPNVPVKTLQEFITLARAKPAALSYGSGGQGSSTHLSGEWFKSLAGVHMLHIPYRGGSAAVQGMISGQVDASFLTVPSILSFAQAGRMNVLAVSGEKRAPTLPNVPTTTEAGLPRMAGVNWNGLFVSAKTPTPIVTQLNKEITAVLSLPEVRSQFAAMALDPAADTPEQASAFIAAEVKRWTGVIKDGNIKAD